MCSVALSHGWFFITLLNAQGVHVLNEDRHPREPLNCRLKPTHQLDENFVLALHKIIGLCYTSEIRVLKPFCSYNTYMKPYQSLPV